MANTNCKQVHIDVLRRHGFYDGRPFANSKPHYAYGRNAHFCVSNGQIFTKHDRVLRRVNLDLTVDEAELTSAAYDAGQNFYVLNENKPCPGWKPDSMLISRVLRDAIWWTRIFPDDQDLFLPVNYRPSRRRSGSLSCSTGHWRNRPAYSIELWTNDKWGGCNMSGAVAEILGVPPKDLRRTESGEVFTSNISGTRGQSVRPVFYHRVGQLEYIWFSNGLPFPAILYDWSAGLLGSVVFSWHRDHGAIHVWRASKVVRLLWPCRISAWQVAENAQKHLRESFRNDTQQ